MLAIFAIAIGNPWGLLVLLFLTLLVLWGIQRVITATETQEPVRTFVWVGVVFVFVIIWAAALGVSIPGMGG
jgi:cell division protein FtsW (lipid II flippase)